MTKLADKLGIKLRDFLVASGDLTNEQINQILDRCVKLGAVPCEFLEGYGGKCASIYGSGWEYFGVNSNCTAVTDMIYENVLPLEVVLSILQLKRVVIAGVSHYLPEEDAALPLEAGRGAPNDCGVNGEETLKAALDTEIEILERTLHSLRNVRSNLP